MIETGRIRITPEEVTFNGNTRPNQGLAALYRELTGGYPKFFKMDGLCKIGFLGAEFLLKDLAPEIKENSAVVLFNRSGSLCTDRNYQKTLAPDNYFPSPALFVYTLANIVTGEIAIRHKIYGETSFYILDSPDREEMDRIVESTLLTSSPEFILAGWLEYSDDSDYIAEMKIVKQ